MGMIACFLGCWESVSWQYLLWEVNIWELAGTLVIKVLMSRMMTNLGIMLRPATFLISPKVDLLKDLKGSLLKHITL
jgi:hypothetical protein